MARIVRIFIWALVIAGAGYWLVADTVRYYLPQDARPLRVSFWGPYQEFEMWQTMLDDYRAAHPDSAVKGEYIPSRYEAKIQRLMVGGDAPDVILYQDEPFPRLVEDGQFLDLTDLINRDRAELGLPADMPLREALKTKFWSTAVDYFGREETRDGKTSWRQYGLPIWGGCNLLYYNKSCFERCKVRIGKHDGPGGIKKTSDGWWIVDDERWTVSEWVEVCKRLTIRVEGDRVEQYGYLHGWWMYWLPFQQTLGARIYNEQRTKTTLYGPAAEASMTLFYDLMWTHRVMPVSGDLGTLNADTGFFTGKIAMVNTGPWAMPFLNESNLDYDVLHIPRNDLTDVGRGERATRITFDALAISPSSKKIEEAWTLIKHILKTRNQQTVAKVQRSIPATRPPEGVVERVIERGEAPTPEEIEKYAAIRFVTYNPDVQVRKFVRVAADYAMMQPVNVHWALMTSAWGESMNAMQREDESQRLSPLEAIGLFYSGEGHSKRLMEMTPPADPKQAAKYREIYLEGERRRGNR